MSKPYVIYIDYVNKEMYRRAMAGVSLSDRMRKCFICDIRFYDEYVYIDELVPVQQSNKADSDESPQTGGYSQVTTISTGPPHSAAL